MRRALEYVRAFDGVISQHAQDPDLAGPHACCHEGELSGRLGLPGWPPARRGERSSPATSMLAEHTGSRVHVAHVSTAEGRRGDPLGQGARHRRHRRGDPAPPAADHRPARRLRPGLQGQPAAAARRGRRRRCARRWPTAPSTPSPPTTPRTPGTTRSTPSSTRRSACSASRPRSRRGQRGDGRRRPARLGRRRAADVHRPGPDRRASPATATRSPSAQPANLTLVDPDRHGQRRPRRLAVPVAQQPLARRRPHRRRRTPRSCAAASTARGGEPTAC